MTRNTNFFDQIEDYCFDQLEGEMKLEFEAELLKNPELRNELELWMEIQSAIEEKEILTLREKLENVAMHNKPGVSCNESFELLDEFSDVQEISEILSSEELINFYDSLPKVHAYHHVSTTNENIHHFYKKQNNSNVKAVIDDFNDFDFEGFEGLEEAILEKDILQFRQTLKQVAKSVEPQFTVEEIDDYLNGELTERDFIEFERDLFQNRALQDEVKLHQNIDLAIQEADVMNLRNQISNILLTETSWNVSEKSIEDFIDGVLEGELLDEFNFELQDNTDLMAEVELRRQVNDSIAEKDILDLRKELKAIKESAEVKKVKMIIPETKIGQIKFWRSSVAILVILLGLAGVLRNGVVSVKNTYDNYYVAPEWSPERSLTTEISLFQQAKLAYLNADDARVVKILDQLPKSANENPVFDFYKSASLQNLDKYNEAIAGYTKVINHGDNMFIEEAEWYRSLCYLKLGNQAKAKQELLAVIDRKGHFEKDAKAVIRRLKYSFK
jgi:hypothetical protein